jgi:hypothetical protein
MRHTTLLLLFLSLAGCAFDPNHAGEIGPDTLRCGWAPSNTIDLEPLEKGCWEVTPETPDKATSYDGDTACDAINGPMIYEGGAHIRTWYWVGSPDHAGVFHRHPIACNAY